jgi:O-antigen/teichoic acid export membrane protein
MIKKSFRLGFFHLLSANLFLQIAGFGMQIFLTRMLLEVDIGRIKILQSFIAIIIILAGLGVNTAILKLCSENTNDDKKQIIFINGFKIILVIATFITVIVYLISSFSTMLSRDVIVNTAMKYYCLQVPFIVLNDLGIAYLQAQKKIQLMSKMQILLRILIIIFSLLMTYIFGFYGYIVGIVGSNIIASIIFFVLFKNEKIRFNQVKVEYTYISKILNIGVFAFAANIIGQITASTDIIMLNYLVGDNEQIAYYGIAQLVIMGLRLIPTTLNQIMTPYLSQHSASIEKVKEIYNTYNKRMFILMLGTSILGILLVPFVIPFIFGQSYKESIQYFRILLIGLFFWSIYSPKGITLLSIGKINFNFYATLVVSVINVILNFIFIKNLGMIGGAYATMISYFLGIFTVGYAFKKVISKVK